MLEQEEEEEIKARKIEEKREKGQEKMTKK